MLLHDIIVTEYWRHSVFTCLQFTLPVNYFSLCKIMGFSNKDKILIKNLHDSKGYQGYGAKKLMKDLPEKGWSKSGLSCNIMSTRDKSIVWMNWNGISSMSGAVLNNRFLMRLLNIGEEDWVFVCAERGHYEYSLFDCCIFNYEIMSATLANTFLFILQGSVLADLRYGGRF